MNTLPEVRWSAPLTDNEFITAMLESNKIFETLPFDALIETPAAPIKKPT